MLLLTIIFQSETHSQTLDVFFKVYTPEADFRNVSISILKNKATAQRFSPPTRRVKIKLDYDAEYLLKFELENCTTKEIYVNTKKVPRHMKDESLEVAFEVELSKNFQFNSEPYMNTSVVHWYYHSDEGNFAYIIDSFPDATLEANYQTIKSNFLNRNIHFKGIRTH
jgi:hypothetical protein